MGFFDPKDFLRRGDLRGWLPWAAASGQGEGPGYPSRPEGGSSVAAAGARVKEEEAAAGVSIFIREIGGIFRRRKIIHYTG